MQMMANADKKDGENWFRRFQSLCRSSSSQILFDRLFIMPINHKILFFYKSLLRLSPPLPSAKAKKVSFLPI